MRSIGSLLNVEVFSLLKVGCVMGNSYHRTLAFTIIMPLVISVFIGIATLIKAEYSKRIALKSQPRYREKDELVRKFKLDNQTNLEEAKKLKVIASDQSLFDLKSSKVKPNEIARQRRASLQRPGENDELAKKKGRQLLKLEEELEKLEILATDNSSDIKASGVTAFLVFTYLIFASTSSIILRTFYCDQFGDDLNFYLVADKKIVCRFYNEEDETFTKNPEYAKLLRMALVGVGIYPLTSRGCRKNCCSYFLPLEDVRA